MGPCGNSGWDGASPPSTDDATRGESKTNQHRAEGVRPILVGGCVFLSPRLGVWLRWWPLVCSLELSSLCTKPVAHGQGIRALEHTRVQPQYMFEAGHTIQQ